MPRGPFSRRSSPPFPPRCEVARPRDPPPVPPAPPTPGHFRGEGVPPDHPRHRNRRGEHGGQPPVPRIQPQPVAGRRLRLPVGMDASADLPLGARRLRGVRRERVVPGGHLLRRREALPVDLPVGPDRARRRNRDGPLPEHRPVRRGHPRGRVPPRRPRPPERRGRHPLHPLPLLAVREIGRPRGPDGPAGVPAADLPGHPGPRNPESRAVREPPARGAVGRVPPWGEGASAGGPRAGHPLEGDRPDGKVDGQGTGGGSRSRRGAADPRPLRAGGVRDPPVHGVRGGDRPRRRRVPYRLWIGDRLRADARDAGGRPAALAALATARCDGGDAPCGKAAP